MQSELPKDQSLKSRNLSILDFYEILQVEWLIADLRRKIYTRTKDKNYWTKVMEGKKDTIEKLSLKNNLPSIFSDSAMLSAFHSKIYGEGSYPAFVYKDQKHESEQSYYDQKYYYNINSDVRVQTFGETKIGKITKEYTPYKDFSVFVTIDGEEKPYSTSAITRIL